jgi:RNA polymerase sigma factor (sigma-70 family)
MSDQHASSGLPAERESAARQLDRAFRRHAGAMYSAALRVLQDRDDAYDAVSDVFRKLAARLRQGSATGWDSAAYLARSAHNETRSILRRRRVAKHVPLDQAGKLSAGTAVTPLEVDMHRRFLNEDVTRAVAELPARKRLLVQLRYGEGRSRSEAAEALGVSVRRLEKLTTDTLAMLRKALAEGDVHTRVRASGGSSAPPPGGGRPWFGV